MEKIKGVAAVAVTATPSRTALPDTWSQYTLINAGTGDVYYRYDPNQTVALFLGAAEAALRTLGGGKLLPGASVLLPVGAAFVDLACITGATATVRIEPGDYRPSVSSAYGGVTSLTYLAGSGQALNCVASATNYTLTVVAGGIYEIVAHNGRIYLGEADTTAAAARICTIPAGTTKRYLAQSTTLNYSTDSGAGVLGQLSRLVGA